MIILWQLHNKRKLSKMSRQLLQKWRKMWLQIWKSMEKCQLRQLSFNLVLLNLIAPLQASLQIYNQRKIMQIVQIMFQLKQLHRSNKLYKVWLQVQWLSQKKFGPKQILINLKLNRIWPLKLQILIYTMMKAMHLKLIIWMNL